MKAGTYTPGHTPNAVGFMMTRSFESHGGFFAEYLRPGVSVLDCGCGPGTITLGIARTVSPGRVCGIDFSGSQVELANSLADEHLDLNVDFREGDVAELPFPGAVFDRVFSHALLEHVSDPVRVLREMVRVLKPGGIIGVCSPDWDGLLLAPPSEELRQSAEAYAALQSGNGGDLRIGRKFGGWMEQLGIEDISMSARYECYPSLEFIGEYLAQQLKRAGQVFHAATFRHWAKNRSGMFAQAWVSAVGTKKGNTYPQPPNFHEKVEQLRDP